ncbi:MAG: sugar phosphate isomerase/epimerase family protein [Armatimonadota bacterium]
MADLKIAVMLSNLRMDYYDGMEVVADMGVPGLHISVTREGFRPEDLDTSDRKKLMDHITSLGLEVSAVSAWGGNVDLGEEDNWHENIEWGKRIMDLAVDLESGIWQGHCGIMPERPGSPEWQRFIDAFGQLAEHGEKVGACLAIETGPEPPFVLRRLLDIIDSEAIRINWDPANLIMWPARFCQERGEEYDQLKWFEKFQPNEGALALADEIVHTHAKDGLVHEDGTREEVPLGEGWVDWPRYIGYLLDSGYDGYFAIERETGDDPVGDIQAAVDFLRSIEPERGTI